MGLFGTTSPFDADVDKATNENNTSELWDVILNICDKVGSSSKNAKDCLRPIMRRLGHNDPHVVMQAITLLDACINNCGKNFHLEIASREFETEYRKLLSKAQGPVAMKMKLSLQKWAESEFKTDPQLILIPSLYQKLQSDGLDFSDTSQTPKPAPVLSKDPNVVNSQQEQDDIAKAIELSLKEKSAASPKSTTATANAYSSIYPSMNGGPSPTASASAATPPRTVEPRKVRALYDFEAAEDNELTFLAGEIIHVVDDTDPNWWKGYNHRGEGLFPSNFVTADLSAEPESVASVARDDKKKSVQFSDEIKKEVVEDELIEINEEKIDRLLHLLHEANPEDPSQDSDEMLQLEAQVNQMLPLIDTELERVDRKHAQLTLLGSDLVEAINLYHTLMREPERGSYRGYPSVSMPPNSMYQIPGSMYQMPAGALGPMPTSLPQNMHMSMGVPPQHMMHMMQPNGFGMGQPLPPNHMLPPHLTNGQIPPHLGGMMTAPPTSGPSSIQPSSMPPHSMASGQPQMGPPPVSMPQQQHMIPNSQQPQQQPPPQQSHQPMNRISGQFSPVPQSFQHPQQQQPAQQQLPPQHMVPLSQHQQMPQPQHQQQQQYQHNPSMQQMPMQMPPHSQHQQHIQHLHQQNPSPNHNMMAVNMALSQPVTNTILPQSDSRTNIPIYQQQRNIEESHDEEFHK